MVHIIHEEWMNNVLANRPDLTRAQLEATRSAMDPAFPAASVSGFESLIPALILPIPTIAMFWRRPFTPGLN